MIKHTIATLAVTLSLASSAVQAQETNCDGWVAKNWEEAQVFWGTATSETTADCLNSVSNVNARAEHGRTPLHYAALHNENPAVIIVLLDAAADVNARDKFGRTPLGLAALRNGNLEVISILLGAGADVNARDEYGYTPLHMAARNNENPEVITLLLNAGADGAAIDDDGETPFDLAKENEALAGTDAYWALNEARFK